MAESSWQQVPEHYDPIKSFVRPEFHLVLVPVLGICLRGLVRRLDASIPGWRWVVDLLAGFCLLYGTFQRKEILQTHSLTDITTTDGIIYQFLVMSLLSWLAAVLLETEIIRLLWKVLSCRDCQWHGLSSWKWVCLTGLTLASINACILMINLSRNVYGSIVNVTNDPNVFVYFALAAVVKNVRVFVQGIVFIVRIGASGFRWVEHRDQVNLSRMGHVALSNIIMIVQSGSLMYTFLNNKGSTSTWSVLQILFLLSLVVDILFRLSMFVWCFANSCCFSKIMTISSRINFEHWHPTHPHFELEFEELDIELSPDTHLYSTVPLVESLVDPHYAKSELVFRPGCSVVHQSILPILEFGIEECVRPELPLPQTIIGREKTVCIV